MEENTVKIIPADGWYFIFDDINGTKRHFYKVAVWKMNQDEEIYGMVAIHEKRELVIVPPNTKNGHYKHITEMSNEEAEELGIYR